MKIPSVIRGDDFVWLSQAETNIKARVPHLLVAIQAPVECPERLEEMAKTTIRGRRDFRKFLMWLFVFIGKVLLLILTKMMLKNLKAKGTPCTFVCI